MHAVTKLHTQACTTTINHGTVHSPLRQSTAPVAAAAAAAMLAQALAVQAIQLSDRDQVVVMAGVMGMIITPGLVMLS